MITIPSLSTNPAINLAIEEYVLNNKKEGEYLMLWISEPSVIIGKFQNPYLEVCPGACERDKIGLYRRNSGGGTVYHDYGNLNYTIIGDKGDSSPDYERFLRPVTEFLKTLSVDAEIRDTSAVFANGLKLSGNAQSVVGGRIMHHGTLLFDSSLDKLNRYTGKPRKTVSSKSIQSNPSPVGNIRPMLKEDMSIDDFASRLNSYLSDGEYVFSAEETEIISSIAKEKYETWEWNYGKTTSFEIDSDGFTLRAKNGITEYSSEFSDILTGRRLEYNEIKKLLCSSADEQKAARILNIIFG